jgi:hypothetical protein
MVRALTQWGETKAYLASRKVTGVHGYHMSQQIFQMIKALDSYYDHASFCVGI